jgi:hypothetical protein
VWVLEEFRISGVALAFGKEVWDLGAVDSSSSLARVMGRAMKRLSRLGGVMFLERRASGPMMAPFLATLQAEAFFDLVVGEVEDLIEAALPRVGEDEERRGAEAVLEEEEEEEEFKELAPFWSL